MKTPAKERPKRRTDGIVIREKTRPGRARNSPEILQKDLVARLNHLRAEAREVCEAYLANLDTDITTLVDFLDGALEVQTGESRKAETMRLWAAALDSIEVKPQKGRRKDLRRIEEAVRAMMRTAFE